MYVIGRKWSSFKQEMREIDEMGEVWKVSSSHCINLQICFMIVAIQTSCWLSRSSLVSQQLRLHLSLEWSLVSPAAPFRINNSRLLLGLQSIRVWSCGDSLKGWNFLNWSDGGIWQICGSCSFQCYFFVEYSWPRWAHSSSQVWLEMWEWEFVWEHVSLQADWADTRLW